MINNFQNKINFEICQTQRCLVYTTFELILPRVREKLYL